MDSGMFYVEMLKKGVMKFLTITLLIGMAAACSSVTDANVDLPATSSQISGSDNDPWYESNGDTMDPIIPRPPNPGLP